MSGYRMQWVEHPPPLSYEIKVTHKLDQELILQSEVQEMLQKYAIEKVLNVSLGFSATFFSGSQDRSNSTGLFTPLLSGCTPLNI